MEHCRSVVAEADKCRALYKRICSSEGERKPQERLPAELQEARELADCPERFAILHTVVAEDSRIRHLRGLAKKRGWRLVKSRVRTPGTPTFGLWKVKLANRNRIVFRYPAGRAWVTLAELKDFLTFDLKKQSQ